MIMTNEISFEENSLDLIEELTESSIFDEYVNYDRILSESVMLSEAQEMKLDVLREFSMADIKNKIVKFFQKIKEFIQGIILKIKIFFKNIGKDKVFKSVGEALKKLTPEQRNKKVAYVYADFGKVGKGVLDTTNLTKITGLADKIIKADEETLKELKGKKPEDFMISANGTSLAEVIKVISDSQFSFTAKNDTVVQAYNDITKMSGQIDAVAKNVNKIGEGLKKQADKLTGTAKSIKDDKPNQAQLIKSLVIPAMKGNSKIFTTLSKGIVKVNTKLLKELVKLVKGKDSAIGGNIEKASKDFAAGFGVDLNDTKIGESYDPWAGLE